MSISPAGGLGFSPLSRLTYELQKQGLSSDKANYAATQLKGAVDSAISNSGGRLDRTTIRSAIDGRLDADVKSGALSSDGAALIRKSLDEFDRRLSQGGGRPPGGRPPGGVPPGGKPPGGAGGAQAQGQGGGESSIGVKAEKTETSRESSTAGGVTTTTITYSDGSKSTKTSYGDSDSDAASSSQSSTDALLEILKEISPDGSAKAAAYVKNLTASDLIDVKT